MRLRQRIIKLEKELSAIKSKQEKKELNPIISTVIENHKEFRECLKQLYRLRWKAEQDTFEWKQWQEPYREEAEMLIIRMNGIIQQHRESQVNWSI